MPQYLIELLNAAVPYIGCIPLFLFPMWKTRDASNRFVIIYCGAFLFYLCAALLIAKRFLSIDADNIQTFKVAITLPANILPFLVFRKRPWQNIFLLAIAVMYSLICVGAGMYLGDKWFADNPLFAANIISFGVIAVTLPPLLYMLRRLHGNPNMKQAVMFWRFAWLVPGAFFMIVMVAGGLYSGDEAGAGFIVIRVFTYAVLLLICYLFDIAVRQIAETEAAKRAAEENAAKAEFYRRMSHDLRTPLTIVSTNIQTAHRRPEEADVLLPQSQDEIMRMAKMIDDALDDEA